MGLRLAFIGWALLQAACQPVAGQSGAWQVVADAGDTLGVVQSGEVLRIDLRSKKGIGRAVITPPDTGWPARVELRLHLRGLESLRLEAGEFGVAGYVSSGADSAPRFHDLYAEPQIADEYASELVVEDLRATEGVFLLRFPTTAFRPATTSLSLAWVDFFR